MQERSRSLRMVEDENRIVCLDCRPEKNYEIIFLRFLRERSRVWRS
ncbi:hypothetical protein LptCag_2501 [Leptospirillum ferriphilum]|uniref:Uncharacterized protein n=1 Tax=Leptospirillum ferriphilum TaxID=178606 RepID=A0A094WHD5_9BACT|nr:hypothetical protein LptCag_2501 [Leptospirillum ferriphilum]